MDERDERNLDLESFDIFKTVNNYFLLFFGFACILSSIYIQGLFIYLHQDRIGITVSDTIGIILPIFLFMRRFPLGFRRQLSIHSVNPATVFYVILSTFLIVIVVDFIYILSQRFFPVPTEYLEGLKTLKPEGPGTFLLTFLGLCIVVPFAEELVFRGIFQQVFDRNMNGVLAFLLAGLLFGVVHLSPHLLISISLFGVFLGFLFYSTKNLSYTIIAHCVFNTVSLIQLSTTSVEHLEELPFYIMDMRFLIASVVLLTFFLLKIKRGGSQTEPPEK